jgi:predicted Ser/Thr protein kinase
VSALRVIRAPRCPLEVTRSASERVTATRVDGQLGEWPEGGGIPTGHHDAPSLPRSEFACCSAHWNPSCGMPDPMDAEFFALQEALVGRYSLEREIGRGGMGIVYLAHEVALDRPVALKLLPPAMAAQPALRERFLREARTAAKLSHPNIVAIYSVDEVDEFVFFVMAYIDGGTLGERVRDRGPVPSHQAVTVLREVAWALAYAHAEGVVHRDVKPDNILLETGGGRALVTDFGIAQVGYEPGETADAGILGTAEFISPEQAIGEDVDARSDLYSLGVVGFYALTGRFPFEDSDATVLLSKHLTEPAPPVASIAQEVPTEVARAIDRCLRKDPEDRYADGGMLAEAIGEGTELGRQLPIPVRVFMKQVRELVTGVPMILIMWLSAPLAWISLILGVEGALFSAAWGVGAGVLFVLVLLGMTFGPMGSFAAHTRRLLRAGFGIEDVRRAFEKDVARRNEEIRFEYGKEITWIDRILTPLAWSGLGMTVVSVTALSLGAPQYLDMIPVISVEVALWSAILKAARNTRRRDAVGEWWSGVVTGRVGKWLFKLGGLGLENRLLNRGGAHRPTEMAIGIAADRLFEELPRSTKRDLQDLPDIIQKLEVDAQDMRQQVEELNGVLAEIGDDPGRVGGEERTRLRTDLVETRDLAQSRMTEAVSALEKIRLGLLRLHAGAGSVESVTMDLSAAQVVSDDIDHLLAGKREVDELLGIARSTQELATPLPG